MVSISLPGKDYFQLLGAQLIASEKAIAAQHMRVKDQFFQLGNPVSAQAVAETNSVYSEKAIVEKPESQLDDIQFEVHDAGQAHTRGNSCVWLPQQKVIFTAGIVHVERMRGILVVSRSKRWINAFESMAADEPEYVVPGHSAPTDPASAKKDTDDYLVKSRQSVAKFMENGGDIADIGRVD